MIRLLAPICMMFAFAACYNASMSIETQSTEKHEEIASETQFDAALAAKYGADDYGMKKYIMAFLYRGENREQDSAKAAELQKAHMANISRLADEKKLVVAGPFFGNEDLRGIYLFNVQSLEEAALLTQTDPAIQQGHLRMELKEWYGSAAMEAVGELHKKIAKIDI